jgi:hypothetical protein
MNCRTVGKSASWSRVVDDLTVSRSNAASAIRGIALAYRSGMTNDASGSKLPSVAESVQMLERILAVWRDPALTSTELPVLDSRVERGMFALGQADHAAGPQTPSWSSRSLACSFRRCLWCA